MSQANCKGQTELFYPPPRGTESHREMLLREAKARVLCSKCAVAIECRSYARRNGEYGMWGSESENERFLQGFIDDKDLRRKERLKARRAERRAAKEAAIGTVLVPNPTLRSQSEAGSLSR